MKSRQLFYTPPWIQFDSALLLAVLSSYQKLGGSERECRRVVLKASEEKHEHVESHLKFLSNGEYGFYTLIEPGFENPLKRY